MYIINFEPSYKQWQAYELLTDKTTNFIGYGGSARSGKSYLLAYWLTAMCLAYPDTAWGLGRKELKNLKRTTLLTLFKVFAECGLVKDVDYKYNQQDQKITFNNKSDIFLIDTAYQPSDPLYTRFGGLELTGCAIDESNETKIEAIEILFTRIGWRNNDKYDLGRKMLETFNPDKGHVYTRYYKPHKNRIEREHIKFIPALPKDNPHPSTKVWIEDMVKTADEKHEVVFVAGNWHTTYCGFDAMMVATSMAIPMVGFKSGKFKDGEEISGINYLPWMRWDQFMFELSKCKYGVHMYQASAGQFPLNCSYLGIPCVGPNDINTQRDLHPMTSIDRSDLIGAVRKLQLLQENKDFYEECSYTTKKLYEQKYSEKAFLERVNFL